MAERNADPAKPTLNEEIDRTHVQALNLGISGSRIAPPPPPGFVTGYLMATERPEIGPRNARCACGKKNKHCRGSCRS